MGWLPLSFGFPAILFGLLALPVIWWLLRLTPPKPQTETFPPLRILARVMRKEETPHQSPWWLTLLRLLMAALVIMFLDYAFIFRPMREEIRANFLERTDRFQTLHSWSEGINSFEYLLVIIATVLLLAARSSAPSRDHPPAAAIARAAIPTDGTAASERPLDHGESPVGPHP